MPGRLLKPRFNFNQPGFTQISESHCGPAVIQMMLSHLNIIVTQNEVAEAGGATDLIELNGMRVDQLAQAVRHLAPLVDFWYKDHSTLDELITLVTKYRYPVGVEWQGLFEDDDEDEDEEADEADEGEPETGDDDYGHYSIITHVDRRNRQLIIADPYKDYISQARIFSFEEFEDRWWDFNELTDPQTGWTRLVKDYHMMFIITPKSVRFPARLGLQKFS